MWSVSDIQDGHQYVLALTQSSTGRRRFVLKDVGADEPEAVFFTEVVPNALLLTRHLKKIAEQVLLKTGKRFFVDAHGIWLTEEEMAALMDDKDESEVPWLNNIPPNFAPK